MKKLSAYAFIVLLLPVFVRTAAADVRLPAVFSDNMVLQRGIAVPIWGWADEGEVVTVKFRNQVVNTTPVAGKWMARLKPLTVGGPDTLTVSGKNSIELKNVLVGEVWVCSGQSNMEWQLKRAFEPQAAIAAAGNPKIRLLTVEKSKSDKPLEELRSFGWRECTSESAADFSAVGYYFGRDLQKALGVPVGLIHTSWGGSPAEVWMSAAVLESNPAYKRDILDASVETIKRYESEKAKFDQDQKDGKLTADSRPPRAPWKPTELYNSMIHPLIPYAIKGAIWYQGESNAGRAQQYRTLFPDMIRNWRKDWGQGDFTFLLVQLAPYDKSKKRSLEQIMEKSVDSDWAELREAQLLSTRVLPKVGMAVITDLGEKDDIHPTRKEPVGARLALAARKIAYGQGIISSGPTFMKLAVKGNQAVLSFDNVDKGLEARDGELKGFAICGEDRNFVWAKAEIRGKKVVVSSPQVAKPFAVRYGWADFPVVNLWNKDGLPATPFRTDTFPGITK